jgi:hypothetical protein
MVRQQHGPCCMGVTCNGWLGVLALLLSLTNQHSWGLGRQEGFIIHIAAYSRAQGDGSVPQQYCSMLGSAPRMVSPGGVVSVCVCVGGGGGPC